MPTQSNAFDLSLSLISALADVKIKKDNIKIIFFIIKANKLYKKLKMFKGYLSHTNCLQLEDDLFPIRLCFIKETIYSNFFIVTIK